MTDIYYDCEFIEDGRTIDLISIGMVAETGAEYYTVSNEFDLKKIAASDWLMANVWPSLPQVRGDARMMLLAGLREGAPTHRLVKRLFEPGHPDVKPRVRIADEVRQFILSFPDPQLWSWFGAYDHVVLCQLWGSMVDLPRGVPMWTNDLQQEIVRLGVSEDALPKQAAGHHNALQDAGHHREIGRFLRQYQDLE